MTMTPVTATPAAPKNTGPAPTGGGAQRTPVAPKGAFAFMPVTAQKKSKYLNILLYSAAGSGKTTLAGSAADVPETLYSKGYCPEDQHSSDVLLISAEGGDLVFEGNDRINNPDRIDMIKVDRIEQVQNLYKWLAIHIQQRDTDHEANLLSLQNTAFFGEENKKMTADEAEQMGVELIGKTGMSRLRRYRTVILDSLTDIEAQNMNHIMGINDKGFDIGDELSPAGYSEFRKNNNTIQQLVRSFRDLKVNLIVICGQKYAKDEKGAFHYTPWMTGQLATQIQSFVDIVGYMVPSQTLDGKDIRKLYVQPVPQVKFDAKCRIASFKKTNLEDPYFIDLLIECGYVARPAS